MIREKLTHRDKEKRLIAFNTLGDFAKFMRFRAVSPAKALTLLRNPAVIELLRSKQLRDYRKAAELLL